MPNVDKVPIYPERLERGLNLSRICYRIAKDVGPYTLQEMLASMIVMFREGKALRDFPTEEAFIAWMAEGATTDG